MMTGSQILRSAVSAATARLDRGLPGPDFDPLVEEDLGNWLHQISGRIRLAISRRIPIGFENETGFHLGVQPAPKKGCRDREQAGVTGGDEHF